MSDVVELTIRKLPDGGYLVLDAFPPADRYGYGQFKFASAEISDALAYMRGKLLPKKASN